MIKRLLVSACLTVAATTAVIAPANAEILQDMPIRAAKKFLIPAYDKLAETATAQDKAWQQGCGDVENLIAAYHQAADSWAHIQYMNYGPVTLLLRRDRLYHWPERRNAVTKALGKLLAEQDDNKLTQDSFPRISVAGQGLPALERLLFEDGMMQEERACKTGQAIARNIKVIAEGTARDWQSGDLSMLDKLETGQPHDIWFDNNEEVAHKFYTEMLAGFQMITDQKLLLPMGKDISKANGKRSEAWRSQRSTRNIQHNIIGLVAMAKSFQPWIPEDKKPAFHHHIENMVFAAGALPNDLPAAVTTEERRAALLDFKTKLRTSRDGLIDIFSNDLGLVMGFNSLDGD